MATVTFINCFRINMFNMRVIWKFVSTDQELSEDSEKEEQEIDKYEGKVNKKLVFD